MFGYIVLDKLQAFIYNPNYKPSKKLECYTKVDE